MDFGMLEMNKSHDFASKKFAKNPFCLVEGRANKRRVSHLLIRKFSEIFKM
jgi:hypothetical protein